MTEPAHMNGPHQNQPVARTGASLDEADVAMILIHGRGATAQSILTLADEFSRPECAFLAPQAAGRTWYPHSFLMPLHQNEPGISSGLQAIDDVLTEIEDAGIPTDRTVLLGFSQGACLATEYAARHARRFGGVVALSGGLIGMGQVPDRMPPDDKHFDYDGSLADTPVFIGCSDADAHIPVERVHRTTEVMQALGGDVTERIYEGMGHTVNADEVRFVRELLASLV